MPMNAAAAADALPVNAARWPLGEKLFVDKRLSGDNTVACVTCHDFSKAGTDNKRFAEGIRGQFGDINAPTMFNAAFNTKQFWNGRAADPSGAGRRASHEPH